MSDSNTDTNIDSNTDTNNDNKFPPYDGNKMPFPESGFQPSTCGTSYEDMLSQEGLFNDSIKKNPEVAKSGLDPGSCKTSNTEDTAKASAGGPSIGSLKSGEVKASNTYKKQTTSGCSAIALQYALNENLTNSLNCTCQNLQNESSSSASSTQTLTLKIQGSTFKGEVNMNFNQGATTDAKIINFTSASVQNQLKSSMKASLNSLNKAAQSKKVTGTNFTTPSAQKSLQSSVAAVVSSAAQTLDSDVMSKAIQSVCNVQDETLTIIGSTFDSNVNITSLQTSSIKFVVSNIAKAVVGSIMENSNLSTQIQKTVQTQKDESKKEDEAKKGSSADWIFLALLLVSLIFFSIDKEGKHYNLPQYRFIAFWFSITCFLILLLISLKKKGFWITGLVFVILAIILNIFTIAGKSVSWGNGMKYVFQYKTYENNCSDVDCTLILPKPKKSNQQSKQLSNPKMIDNPMRTDTNFIIRKKNQSKATSSSSVPKPIPTKIVAPKSKINNQTIRTHQGTEKMNHYLDRSSATKLKKE